MKLSTSNQLKIVPVLEERDVRLLLLEIVRIAAVLLLGLFAGGVFFLVLAPSVSRLPAPAYLRYWQALNTDYGRVMPPFLLTCLALLVVTCVLSYQRGWAVFGLTVAALLMVAAVVVLTVTQLEPLNRLADSWNPDQPPTGWTDTRQRWWTLHTLRTVLAVLAFAGLLLAQAVDRGSSPTTGITDSASLPSQDTQTK